MSDPAHTPAPPGEKTFRSFTEKQGENYAQNRRDYHARLYQLLIDYHTSTGGQFSTIVDVGCGPGTAVRTLAPRFDHAIGLDPSEGMIGTARSLGGASSGSEAIRFEVSTAEDLGSRLSPAIPDGSVDLIIAATAAHWFNMPAFWPRAAQILKAGGTAALWCGGSLQIDPIMPQGIALQPALDRLEERIDDYKVPGNRAARELYVSLPLPWTMEPPVLEFDKATFVRKEWGTDSSSESSKEFYNIGSQPANLDMLEMVLGTASPVIRWRETHVDAVGTERDLVRITRREIETLFQEAGVEKGKEVVTGGVAGVLLMMKKKPY